MQPTYPTVPADGSVQISLPYVPPLPPGVGQSDNKARPKRKPRPKKSARGKK